MTQTINVADFQDTSFREIRLKSLMQLLSQDRANSEVREGRIWNLKPGDYAKRYLKLTDQFRRPFEMCLKKLDGETSESWTGQRKKGFIHLYEEITAKEGKQIRAFASDKINEKKVIILDFTEIEKNIDSTNRDRYDFFIWYGFDVLDKPHELVKNKKESPKRVRIYDSSKTIMDKLEGKLREIAKFSCIHEAIEFTEQRIRLQGKYKFKKLVRDLDELFKDFLVDTSKNEINHVKVNQGIKNLVNEALNSYEVLDKPQYLIDENSYRSALRSKFKRKLNIVS